MAKKYRIVNEILLQCENFILLNRPNSRFTAIEKLNDESEELLAEKSSTNDKLLLEMLSDDTFRKFLKRRRKVESGISAI